MQAYDTDMIIPIANAIDDEFNYDRNLNFVNLKKINNLRFIKPNSDQFPSLKFLKNYKNKNKDLDVILIAGNDELVNYYLKRKIFYTDIIKLLNKLLKIQLFRENLKKKERSLDDIFQIVDIVKSKIKKLVY